MVAKKLHHVIRGPNYFDIIQNKHYYLKLDDARNIQIFISMGKQFRFKECLQLPTKTLKFLEHSKANTFAASYKWAAFLVQR
jgi:hypothetical protein